MRNAKYLRCELVKCPMWILGLQTGAVLAYYKSLQYRRRHTGTAWRHAEARVDYASVRCDEVDERSVTSTKRMKIRANQELGTRHRQSTPRSHDPGCQHALLLATCLCRERSNELAEGLWEPPANSIFGFDAKAKIRSYKGCVDLGDWKSELA